MRQIEEGYHRIFKMKRLRLRDLISLALKHLDLANARKHLLTKLHFLTLMVRHKEELQNILSTPSQAPCIGITKICVPASRFLKFKFVSTRQIDAEGLVSSGT
jgi:hypothetical protein